MIQSNVIHRTEFKELKNHSIMSTPHKTCCPGAETLYCSTSGETIEQFAKRLSNCDADILNEEYLYVVEHENEAQSTAFSRNVAKNRYEDIPCADHQRVILNVPSGKSDYIHANYVHGYNHYRRYICTQAPTEKSMTDFWRMVWQEQSVVIISLTKLIESGIEKCSRYWPTAEWKAIEYGKNIIVQNKHMKNEPTYDLTELRIKNKAQNAERTVYHYLYLRWADYAFPSLSDEFLEFLQEVNNKQTMAWSQLEQNMRGIMNLPTCESGPPLIIHCSAGVGRTGTFVALDISLRKLEDTRKICLKEIVTKIRKQRAMAVQRVEQYMFLNLAIVQYSVNKGWLKSDSVDLWKFVNTSIQEQHYTQLPAKDQLKTYYSAPTIVVDVDDRSTSTNKPNSQPHSKRKSIEKSKRVTKPPRNSDRDTKQSKTLEETGPSPYPFFPSLKKFSVKVRSSIKSKNESKRSKKQKKLTNK